MAFKELAKKLQVPYLMETYGFPIFLLIGYDPHLFVFKKHRIGYVKKYIFNHMVENRLGNGVRCVLYGNWKGAFPYVFHPFKRNWQGIFQLPDPVKLELNLPEEDRMAEVEKYINPKWLKRILENTENALARAITVIIDFNVQWQDWERFWLNPKNCNRDVWPTTSGEWHYYEYWDMEGGERIRRTGLIIENFEQYMKKQLMKIAKKFNPHRKDFLVFSAGNEVIAGMGWHQRKSDIFKALLHRKVTSIWGRVQGFYWEKQIYKYFLYSIHGIGDPASYQAMEDKIKADCPSTVRWLPSCDGFPHPWPKEIEIKELVYRILKDKNLGLELIHGLWERPKKTLIALKEWDWTSVSWMMKGFRRWRREQGD